MDRRNFETIGGIVLIGALIAALICLFLWAIVRHQEIGESYRKPTVIIGK